MGRVCNLKSESCGSKCTGYDGTMGKTVTIPKNSNAWDGLRKVVQDGVWCDTCRDDGVKRLSGLQDAVNLSIGEKSAFNAKNFNDFADWVKCTRDACKKDGRC